MVEIVQMGKAYQNLALLIASVWKALTEPFVKTVKIYLII